MYELIPFKVQHLSVLLDQPINQGIRGWVNSGGAEKMETSDSMTIVKDGAVMVCGGISEYWEGRGHVWSIFSEESKKNFVPVFRIIKSWVRERLKNKYRRIELSVPSGFLLGHRRAKMLGFELETVAAKNYLPSGQTCSIYSLVRGG